MGRVFGFLSIVITLAIGMYIYSLQVKTLTPGGGAGGGNPQDLATITGVKNDLIGIANAERGYQASQGKYASLEELTAGNYLSIKGARHTFTMSRLLPAAFGQPPRAPQKALRHSSGLPKPCKFKLQTESLSCS